VPNEGETWTVTSKPGSNGFFILLLTLSWWVHLAPDDVDFGAALCDTTWVLDEMITNHCSQKRPHDGDTDSNQISHKKR
jgi:hypothetical protein